RLATAFLIMLADFPKRELYGIPKLKAARE
ncbi:MAG: hypothetical protein QOE73_431, partial [Verrucomicrobiota bacterium]